MTPHNHKDIASVKEDFEDFFENSLSGYIITDSEGVIERANARISQWMGLSAEELKGQRFSNLLSIGGRIYYETHLWPLLRMQGFFDEVALELSCSNGEKLQVLANAYERRDADADPRFIRLTIFKASDRRRYEQNLKDARANAEINLSNALELSVLKEQFIAVLGHDLRNPLGSIMAGTSLLAGSVTDDMDKRIVQVITRSANRMAELIGNIMDFARSRLGSGIQLNRQLTDMEPTLTQVVDEISLLWPERAIRTSFDFEGPANCDAARISQLFSNLLANAITHGASDSPVHVEASHKQDVFQLSVINQGDPIPPEHIGHLFEPFTRENSKPSQQGLGLGLYIAWEISRAHNGELTVASNTEETRFTFRMPGAI